MMPLLRLGADHKAACRRGSHSGGGANPSRTLWPPRDYAFRPRTHLGFSWSDSANEGAKRPSAIVLRTKVWRSRLANVPLTHRGSRLDRAPHSLQGAAPQPQAPPWRADMCSAGARSAHWAYSSNR